MLVVYIAGPISASSAWVREQNIIRAETLLLEVLDAGFAGICVHSGARTFYGERPEQLFLDADFALIERCDAILLVPGWAKSSGTKKEIAYAEGRKIPVFQFLVDLQRWAAAVQYALNIAAEEILEDWRTAGAASIGVSLDKFPEPWMHPAGVADPRVGGRVPHGEREKFWRHAIKLGALAPQGATP